MERWQAELVLDARANLGEGPVWDARTSELLWVDIMAGLVHRFDPAKGTDISFDVGQPVGAVVPRSAGGYALAVRDGFAITEAHADDLRLVAPIDLDRPKLRMNDGACDSSGRFWAGTMHVDEVPDAGSLYRLELDSSVETMLGDVTISNGIGWSPDDTVMYYVDTTTLGIDAFDFDAASGAIWNRRRLVTIEEGAGQPDGLVVDEDGCIWLALWEGWGVRRYSPDGTLMGVVNVPVARVTKPAFGGAALDELFITTAAPDTPAAEQPHAGGIFFVRPGVHGLPPHAYAGRATCSSPSSIR
jgi:sugar lactone lactonase YvrE